MHRVYKSTATLSIKLKHFFTHTLETPLELFQSHKIIFNADPALYILLLLMWTRWLRLHKGWLGRGHTHFRLTGLVRSAIIRWIYPSLSWILRFFSFYAKFCLCLIGSHIAFIISYPIIFHSHLLLLDMLLLFVIDFSENFFFFGMCGRDWHVQDQVSDSLLDIHWATHE